MSNTFDGLSNIYQLNASLDQLKQAQQNGTTVNPATAGINATDPETFLLQQQQSFNSMLNSLMFSSNDDNQDNSTSDLSSLVGSNQPSALNTANLQLLNTLEQNSPLLGKEVIYQNSAGAQASGVVAKIQIDQNSNPIFILTDGTQIPIQSILGLKNS